MGWWWHKAPVAKRVITTAHRPLGESAVEVLGIARRIMPEGYVDAYQQAFPEETRIFAPRPLDFHGEPDCFYEGEGQLPYRGQDHAKEIVRLEIQSLDPTRRIKLLLTGVAGVGKTTFARISASELQGRHLALGLPLGEWFELLPAQVETKPQLDRFMRELARYQYAAVFIDEVHTLKNLESLFHVLHDSGETWYPCADGERLIIPRTISWLTATTDPGELDKTTGGAFRRRVRPEIRFRPPSVETLVEIITDAARTDGITPHPDAVWNMGERALFPWQAKELYETARKLITVQQATDTKKVLGPEVATKVFALLELDERGLLREDRDVIAALLRVPQRLATRPEVVRYKMSEEALCAAAGLDRITYKKRIQPKLMRLGLLTVTGGQCLTERGVDLYHQLAVTP